MRDLRDMAKTMRHWAKEAKKRAGTAREVAEKEEKWGRDLTAAADDYEQKAEGVST